VVTTNQGRNSNSEHEETGVLSAVGAAARCSVREHGAVYGAHAKKNGEME
jgi:hypothetical protein